MNSMWVTVIGGLIGCLCFYVILRGLARAQDAKRREMVEKTLQGRKDAP